MQKKRRLVWALALDGHGVVYRRKREVVDALVEALAEEGLIFSKEEARSLYLQLQEQTFAGVLSYEGMVKELHYQLGLGSRVSPAHLDQLIQKFSAEIQVDPDLSRTLREIRSRGVRVGMLTNSIHPAKVKTQWLKTAGVDDLFDLLLSSVEEHCKKPSPEFFQRFAMRLALPSEHVAFLGHDQEEIEGAREAGLVAIALACPLAPADFHIQRFRELIELPIWPEKKEA